MNYSYDREADALYIALSDSPVDTTKQIDAGIMVDIAESGQLVGVEVLRPMRSWSTTTLGGVLIRFDVPVECRGKILRLLDSFQDGTAQF